MQSSVRRGSGGHGQRRSLLGGIGRTLGVGRRRYRTHDWPLALSDAEQGILATLALKGYEAGESAVEDPNDNLHKVAAGVVEVGLADKRSAAARRRRERADAIAAAPAAAERARRSAEARNANARARVQGLNEATLRRADAYERAAKSADSEADAKEKEAFRLRRKEERLPAHRREPAKLVVHTGSFELSLGKTTNWLIIAVISAILEGAILFAPVLQKELDLPDLALAGLTGAIVSMMGTSVAIIGGRSLAADMVDPSWRRRGLLVMLAGLLIGVMVGFILARVGGWWVGLAVAATWTSGSVTGWDLERRALSTALLDRCKELAAAAEDLRERAAGHRAAAERERESANAVAAEVEPEEPPLLHAHEAADADGQRDIGQERADGLKLAYKGVIDHQIGLGRADRAEAARRRQARPLIPAPVRAAIGAAVLLIVGAGGFALGEGSTNSATEAAPTEEVSR